MRFPELCCNLHSRPQVAQPLDQQDAHQRVPLFYSTTTNSHSPQFLTAYKMDRPGAAPNRGNEEKRVGGNGNENGHNVNVNERLVVAVILVGNAGVGKTSIMNRYVNSSFVPNLLEERGDGDLRATPKVVNIGGREVELSFVDGSGLHEVKDQTIDNLRNYMRAIVMVYDVTDVRSFNSLNTWLRRIETNHGGEITPDCCLLVGNKIDASDNRRVPYGMAQNWVDRRGIKHYVEMSAKRGKNVKSAIENLVVRVLEWQGIDLNFDDDRRVHGGMGGNGGAGNGAGINVGARGEGTANGGVGGYGAARNIDVNGIGIGGANNGVVGNVNGIGGANNGVGGNNGDGGNGNGVGVLGDIRGDGNINNYNGDGDGNGGDSSDDANENKGGRLKGCCWW